MAEKNNNGKDRYRWQVAALIAAIFSPLGMYFALNAGLGWIAVALFAALALAFGVTMVVG